jgi:hypothetical protein
MLPSLSLDADPSNSTVSGAYPILVVELITAFGNLLGGGAEESLPPPPQAVSVEAMKSTLTKTSGTLVMVGHLALEATCC